MTDYQQGAARQPTDYGPAALAVATDDTYRPLKLDAEGRLLTSPGSPSLPTSSDLSAPAANTGAVVTYAAPGLGLAHAIDSVLYSASGTIAAAVELTVTDGGTTVIDVTVSTVGVQQVLFPSGLRATPNAALVVTLPALGAAGTGRVNCLGHRVIVVDQSLRNGLADFRQPSQSQYTPAVL